MLPEQSETPSTSAAVSAASQVNVQELWRLACQSLQQNMSVQTYTSWIAVNPLTDFRLIGSDRAIGVITSPTAFHSTNIEKNFYAQIKEVLDQISGRNSELQFRVGTPVTPIAEVTPVSENTTHSNPDQVSAPAFQTLPESMVSQPMGKSISAFQERLKEMAQNVASDAQNPSQQPRHPQSSSPSLSSPNSSPYFAPATNTAASAGQHSIMHKKPAFSQGTTGDLFSESTIRSMTVDRARIQAQRAGLKLEYTFETFAVSTTNELAHAAAQAVSSQPGTAYNPLFIYGGVGVGKTHLMHAVGNNILKNTPEAKILYVTGEDFTNEIVSAIQTKKALVFKEKYRTVNVLLIDDVQFIAGKNTVQEEFFHTFNTITKHAGQVILTSDRPPSEISLLEDRLKSRFEAGLMVDIQQPSFELRTAILLIKANAVGLQIPMDLAQVIASRVDSARKIEGLIKSIRSEVELKHRAITAELIDELCKVEIEKPVHRLRVKPYDVIKTVADFYNMKQSVIRGKQRVASIVKARHIAMYFLKEELNLPYMEVGRWFSNRDHTSAMHALKKIHSEIQEDAEVRTEVSQIRTLLEKLSK